MDATLIYGLVSIGAGVVVLLIKYGFKSKCSNVSLCFGLIKIERDIEQEIEEQKMEMPSRSVSLQNINNV